MSAPAPANVVVPTPERRLLALVLRHRAELRRAHGSLNALRPRTEGKTADHIDSVLFGLDKALRRADEEVARALRDVQRAELPANALPTAERCHEAHLAGLLEEDEQEGGGAQMTLITGGKS